MAIGILSMLARRIPWAVVTIICASLIAFSIMFFAPGNPAEAILTTQTGNEPTREAVASFMEERGLDQPFTKQYTSWVLGIAGGDLGTSIRTGKPIWQEFTDRFGATVSLALAALGFSAVVGVSVGVASALWQGSWIDRFGNLLSAMGTSMPSFWLALLMVLIFSIYLDWLPSYGYGEAINFILPTLALGLHQVARLIRISRESTADALQHDFVDASFARGVKTPTMLLRHALPNAAIPIVTQLGLDLGGLLGGAVIIENIFGWPGIGNFMLTSVMSRDYPSIASFVLILAVIFIIVNMAVDILYMVLDPRIRTGSPANG